MSRSACPASSASAESPTKTPFVDETPDEPNVPDDDPTRDPADPCARPEIIYANPTLVLLYAIKVWTFALAKLVGLVGPIRVGAPEPLVGENTAQFLLVDQYRITSLQQRVDMLEQVARVAAPRRLVAILSCGCMSTGIPRPLSTTEIPW